MPFLNFDGPEEKPAESWDSIQKNFAESDIGFDESPTITKTASNTDQNVRATTDTTWAGTLTINELYELERHIKEFADEGKVYPSIEKALVAYGYHKEKIRKVFHKVTGIDPVMAYLDTSTYTIPPDAVPRYNYGWGISKDKNEDYYFVLPFVDKYAVYCQRGLNRKISSQHFSLSEAQEELKGLVKDVKAVSPDSLERDEYFMRSVASIQVPTFDNPEATRIASEIHRLKKTNGEEFIKKMIVDAVQEGTISIAEQTQLYCLADNEDPSDMSSEEKLRKDELDKYKKDQESSTLEDEINELKLPNDDFKNFLEEDSQADMKELSNDAYDLLNDIASSVPGFEIKPVGSRVDLVDVQSHSADVTNHIDTGSIRFIINIRDTKNNEELKGLVIMFIVNGRLQYSGKFKGGDHNEYALSTPGINAYFDSVEGKPVDELHYTPTAVPQNEASSPYK